MNSQGAAGRPRYWRGWPEELLASYQQNQGQTNHCAKYAAAAALNLLYGREITGGELVSWLEKKFLAGTPRYTLFGETFGSLMVQTAAIVHDAARLYGLSPSIRTSRGKAADLMASLEDGNKLELISITYLKRSLPRVSYGASAGNALGGPAFFGGHIMVLGACDPFHLDEEGQAAPWGFLSSWARHDHLYWMTDEDFLSSWGRFSPFRRVTVTRT